MPIHDDLGKRMKSYETISQNYLMRRTPVALRIDGKAFHTFTKGFQKPFDDILIKSMQDTMKYLCENIQNCVFGYTQSDEITLILVDYENLETEPWFGYRVDKLCSIAASMATMKFNKAFTNRVSDWCDVYWEAWHNTEEENKYFEILNKAIDKGAMFDCRAFNIPKEEVTNLVYWRQLDAARNSIQMVAQSKFSHKELQNKNTSMLQDMLMEIYNINWNDYATYLKRGSACIRDENGKWYIDLNMPMLKGEERVYLDNLVLL